MSKEFTVKIHLCILTQTHTPMWFTSASSDVDMTWVASRD